MNRTLISMMALLLAVSFSRGDTDVRLDAGKFGKALDARVAPAILDGNPRYGHAPLTVECWVRLLGKARRNVILASDTATSSSHWQLFTAQESGRLGCGFRACSRRNCWRRSTSVTASGITWRCCSMANR